MHFSRTHSSLRSWNIRTCQGTYLLTDRSKETAYIVGLVQSTSGLVFSLASLWWIREECLVRFLLSLWCFQVIVHTSHPFTLAAPSGMPLTILPHQPHWKWDVWVTCLICNYLLCNFVRQRIAHITHAGLTGRWSHLSCHYPGKLDALQTQ